MTTSLKDLAYTHIRGQLLEGRLQPGTRLSSRALAREIGVSFIPVREAITQLAAEGLVDHEPGIGTFAARVTPNDLRELYELREALEIHAIGHAALRIDEEGLREVARWNDKLREIAQKRRSEPEHASTDEDLKAWNHADSELHLALISAGGNTRLVRAVKDLRVLTQVFKMQRILGSADDLEQAWAHHNTLIEALHRRDALLARAVLSEHIRFGCANAIKCHERQRLQA